MPENRLTTLPRPPHEDVTVRVQMDAEVRGALAVVRGGRLIAVRTEAAHLRSWLSERHA